MKNLVIISLICLSTLPTFSQTEIFDKELENRLLTSDDRLIVLDFFATWCAPCKRMDPILKELEQEYGDRVDFYKIDVDKNTADDHLGITSMPTYLFIKNSDKLEEVKGAMSKAKMKAYIESHLASKVSITSSSSANLHGTSKEFSDTTVEKIKNDWRKLNSLAWHAYQEHDDISSLLKAIKIVKKSIAIEQNYYNLDTHAALLYKTGHYTKAIKKAKEAIVAAKKEGEDYKSTSELIEKIIDEL